MTLHTPWTQARTRSMLQEVAQPERKMLYFKEQNLVFLANPKTGTSAIEKALDSRASMVATNPPGLKHMNIGDYRKHIEPLLKRHAGGIPPRVFTVLREPTERLLSWYRYRQRNGPVAKTERSTQGVSAEEFLSEVMSENPRPFAQSLGNQARFCGLANGRRPPDYLFPYEYPAALDEFLLAEFGVIATERVNVSPAGAPDLSPALLERLRRFLADEYELYDGVLKRHGVRPGEVRPAS